MVAKINGSVLHGVEAFPIIVEVYVGNGLGYFITGQPDVIVKETLGRVEVAIKSLGYYMPRTKVAVNLVPAHIRKTGAGFDLPIALGILLASGQIVDSRNLRDYWIAGELGLDGATYPVRGALCMACRVKADGRKGIILSQLNAAEAVLVEGIEVYGMAHLKEVIDFVLQTTPWDTSVRRIGHLRLVDDLPDFQEVRGKENVKRALEVAAAGGHNTLIIGPPGVGKTMLAGRLPSILPAMTLAEILETSRLHSLVGPDLVRLITERPFRSPHHTTSDIALAGGGSQPQPGEISLAHNGVLFLDELYEFNRSAIEVLRQPLEEGRIRILRAKMSLEFPANFMLVAAINPCFCGCHGHPTRRCTCSKRALEYYHRKSASPLLERIDLHIRADSLPIEEWTGPVTPAESSADIRERVIRARMIQEQRFAGMPGIRCNARMPDRELENFCRMDGQTRRFLLGKMDKLQLSARSYTRILKVSRTIADLEGSSDIEMMHVAEAIYFRGFENSILSQKVR